ncbi:MAG: NDP-sugar synthase, partial [Candidatus Bathyarchaeia archaeon]
GIRDVVLLVGYKYQQIKNYFDDGKRFGVNLTYILDRPEFKGSANALLNAYRLGAISRDDCLIAYYGDIISNINLGELASQHVESKAAATVALARGFKIRVGTAEVRDGRITRFIEKPELESPVSIGVLALNGGVLGEMGRLFEERRAGSFDLMGEFIPSLIERGHNVRAYVTSAFWYDLGSMERYERFENDNLSGELAFLFEDQDP